MKKVLVVVVIVVVLVVLSFIPIFPHSNLTSTNYKLDFWRQMQWLSRCGDKYVICE
jgi:uncharacterized protein YxeA